MYKEEFEMIFLKKRLERPIWFELIEEDTFINENNIAGAEVKLNIKFNEDYKWFIENYGSGVFGFVCIYGINTNNQYDIVEQNKLCEIKDFLAISDNGCGDLYGYNLKDETDTKLYFWNHDCHEIEESIYKNIFDYVGNVGFKFGE